MEPVSNQSQRIPLPEACNRLRMSRDQVILRINKGDVDGGQHLGRWFVTLESIERYLAEAAEAASAR